MDQVSMCRTQGSPDRAMLGETELKAHLSKLIQSFNRSVLGCQHTCFKPVCSNHWNRGA